MSDSEKKVKFKWLEKLKNVKHIEIYIAIIFVVLLVLIYFSSTQSSGTKSKVKSNANSTLTITEYVDDLESNLEDILSNIGGVSNVKVMITLDMKQVSISDSKINLDTFPPVKGVIVTAKGLNDTAKRLKVLRAVEAVIDITNGNIEILSSE